MLNAPDQLTEGQVGTLNRLQYQVLASYRHSCQITGQFKFLTILDSHPLFSKRWLISTFMSLLINRQKDGHSIIVPVLFSLINYTLPLKSE